MMVHAPRVKCITKELHEITAILMQNNRYSLCSFFFKTRLAFKVWACEFVLLLPSTCPKTHPFYSACSELVLEDQRLKGSKNASRKQQAALSAQFHPKSVLLFLTVCSIYSFRSSSDATALQTIPTCQFAKRAPPSSFVAAIIYDLPPCHVTTLRIRPEIT